MSLEALAESIPENFTGADFSALTSESYMIAVKEKIQEVDSEIKTWQEEQQGEAEDILPETYFKLRYPDDI